MNAASQVTRVSEFLQDLGNIRWPATLILEYLNDGQRDFARSTSLDQKLSTPLAVSGTTPSNAFYTLPSDFLEIAAGGVWSLVNGFNLQLRAATPNELGSNWDIRSSSQPFSYIWPLEFGLTELRVWPIPPAALTGVTLYYVYLPPDLVAGGSPTTSVLPQQYHLALVYYAVAMCYLQDSQFRDPSKYTLYWDKYQRELKDAQRAAERRFSAAPSTIRRPYL